MIKHSWSVISHGLWHTSLIILSVIAIIEIVFGILILLPFLSPRISESRARRMLKFWCCCIIKDDEVFDSLVATLMRFPSFEQFSFTDTIAGLIMTNLVYHEKKKVIATLTDSAEKLRVKTMRVHEYLNYLRKLDMPGNLFSDQAVRRKSLAYPKSLSAYSVTSLQSAEDGELEKGGSVVDKKGRRCVILRHHKEDGIFEGMRDVEAAVDEVLRKRMQYEITPERLDVGMRGEGVL